MKCLIYLVKIYIRVRGYTSIFLLSLFYILILSKIHNFRDFNAPGNMELHVINTSGEPDFLPKREMHP